MKVLTTLAFLFMAGCSAMSAALFEPGCLDESDYAADEAACQEAGGVWKETSESECPSDRPDLVGDCEIPNGEGYLICAEHCEQEE